MISISDRTLSTILGFIAIALWSTSVAFGRSLSEQLGPLTSASLIYLLGGVLGCFFRALTGRGRGSFAAPTAADSGTSALRARLRTSPPLLKSLNSRYLLGCGSLFVVYMACLYMALGLARNRSQVLEVGLMNYLWPMLTVLLSVPVLRMKASIALLPGALVATAGVLLATTQGQSLSWPTFQANLTQNGIPYLLGMTAAVSWALYSTLSRRWGSEAGSGAVHLFMLGTGVALGLARFLTREGAQWTGTHYVRGRALAELLYMIVGSNLAYAFWERAMRRGDIVLVAACSYLTPLLSSLVSTLYLGIIPGARLWIGCLLVIVGAITCKLAIGER